MQITRLTSIALIYNFKEFLHTKGFTTDSSVGAGFPFVRVMTKDQAYSELQTDCVVIYPSNQFDRELQIGGGYWIKTLYNFDVFADSDAKLSDLVDLIREFLEADGAVLRYDQYSPTYQVSDGLVRTIFTDGTPAQVCSMSFENRTITFLDRENIIGEAKAHSAQVTTVLSVPNM